MTGYEFCLTYWWVFPLAMMLFCFFSMKRNCGKTICKFGAHNDCGESATEILNNRYAKGDIDQREYKEKIRTLIET